MVASKAKNRSQGRQELLGIINTKQRGCEFALYISLGLQLLHIPTNTEIPVESIDLLRNGR